FFVGAHKEFGLTSTFSARGLGRRRLDCIPDAVPERRIFRQGRGWCRHHIPAFHFPCFPHRRHCRRTERKRVSRRQPQGIELKTQTSSSRFLLWSETDCSLFILLPENLCRIPHLLPATGQSNRRSSIVSQDFTRKVK